MSSPIYKEWVEEERREATEKATRAVSLRITKENIIELLEGKFDFVSKDVRKDIEAIDDLALLSVLFRKTIKITSIEEFQDLINKASRV